MHPSDSVAALRLTMMVFAETLRACESCRQAPVDTVVYDMVVCGSCAAVAA